MEGCNSFEVRLLLYGVWDTDIYIYIPCSQKFIYLFIYHSDSVLIRLNIRFVQQGSWVVLGAGVFCDGPFKEDL